MKDKIVFFILGAVVAMGASLVGDIRLSAHDDVVKFKELQVERLTVSKSISVGIPANNDDDKVIRLSAGGDTASILMGNALSLQRGSMIRLQAAEHNTDLLIRDNTSKTRVLSVDILDMVLE